MWFSKKEKPDQCVMATFLIPLREDADVGNGELHPNDRWETLEEVLYDQFGGWTVLSDSCRGGWQETPKKKVVDVSRNYCVKLEEKKLSDFIRVIEIVAVMFRQKCISFECQGKMQLIWQARYKQ